VQVRVRAFARTYTEVGQSLDLREPTLRWFEDDGPLDPAFRGHGARSNVPLLPGNTRTVKSTTYAFNDHSCSASIRYDLTYRLRDCPGL
jgi:hypothetical protein